MRKWKDVALGVITAIGGFIDAGQLLTNAQAGALFRWSLLWTVPLCVVIATLYEEMAARVSMSTGEALFDAVRERLGFRLASIPLAAMCLVNALTLVSELAGMSLAVQEATGVDYRFWAPVCALCLWLVLWRGSFSMIEDGASLLGLFILVFVAAAWALRPPWREIGAAMWRPELHGHSGALYAYTAVALVGAFVSPFQVLFYSSGAVEEKWNIEHRWPNRVTAAFGNVLGGAVAACIVIVAAMTLFPMGVHVDRIDQSGAGVAIALGKQGLWLFLAGLLFCSMAAGLQVSMSTSYAVIEYFGWHWKKDEPPVRSAMFHFLYLVFLVLSLLVVVSGLDPAKITEGAMVLNAVALPFTLFPLLLVARDPRFTRPPLTNGRVSNFLGWFFFVILLIAAVAGLPLYVLTKGGAE